MKNRALVICGPTGTGKTNLGIEAAVKFNGEIISADSRQVYRYMDVMTGKDVNKSLERHNTIVGDTNLVYYIDRGIRIWGYDLAYPKKQYDVAKYLKFFNTVFSDITKRCKLPIIVGGSGLYIDAVTSRANIINVPKNLSLRNIINKYDTSKLLFMLEGLDVNLAKKLNNSDRNNKHRLIRKIEIATFVKRIKVSRKEDANNRDNNFKWDYLWIGLCTGKRESLYEKIERRVDLRTGKNLEIELNSLKLNGYIRSMPIRTIGYKQIITSLDGVITRDRAIEKWKQAEKNYAKRQMTWFRRNKEIRWFDIDQVDFRRKVINYIHSWLSDKPSQPVNN